MYEKILSPLLFCFDPETIHKIVFKTLHIVCKIPGIKSIMRRIFVVSDPLLETTVAGIRFPNPVGLAAGFDKDAKLFNELACFGFGFIEIGTVTPISQPGNPTPRMFRLKEDKAIINRMGFNNDGAEEAAKRLKRGESSLIVGGNIGKNKVTPNEDAVSDYKKCFEILYPYVNYFVVNVSSPNTPGLRGLQEKEPLLILLSTLANMNNMTGSPKPIFLKIAPDLKDAELDDIVDIVLTTKIAGVIATNTTIDRSNLATEASVVESIGMGGLSGHPLTKRSTEVVKYIHNKSAGLFAIIAVGGIMTPDDAIEKLRAGACLVQVYTGFIYKGPSLVREINKAILKERRLS